MPTFTPPTVRQSMPGDRLFSRYGVEVGQSVLLRDGHYALTPFPWQGEIAGKTEGIDYFLGGHEYVVTDDVAEALSADGFDVTPSAGYGEAPYGSDGYGY